MLPAVAAANEVKDASANLIVRFLGPSVDVWAEHFRHWNEGLFAKRAENVNRVLSAADRRRSLPIEQAGTIHPRVLKEILDDGSFVEDQLMAEYFGGVLASSLSGVSRDDRGASMAKLVTELSTYEVRLHFIIYRALKNAFDDSGLSVTMATDCSNMELFFTVESLATAMELSVDELGHGIAGYCLNGLSRHSLIGNYYGFADKSSLEAAWTPRKFPDDGMIVSPTSFGASLFMWAHGLGTTNPSELTNSTLILDYSGIDVPEPAGVATIQSLKALQEQGQVSEQ